MIERKNAILKRDLGDTITSKEFKLPINRFVCKIYTNCTEMGYGRKFQEYTIRRNRKILSYVKSNISKGDATINNQVFFEIKISYRSSKNDTYHIRNINPENKIDYYFLCLVDKKNDFIPKFYCITKENFNKNPNLTFSHQHKGTNTNLGTSVNHDHVNEFIGKFNLLDGTNYDDFQRFLTKLNNIQLNNNQSHLKLKNMSNLTQTKSEIWDFKKLLTIPSYNCNRETELRVPKLLRDIKTNTSIPESAQWNSMVVGVALSNFKTQYKVYKKGEKFLLDGNTRRELYQQYPEYIPEKISISLYYIRDDKHARNEYNTLNTLKASKTSSDYVTAIHRERNFKPTSLKIKSGQYKSAVALASSYADNENGEYMNPKGMEWIKKYEFFEKEIKFLDKQNLDILSKNNTYSSNLLAALLMIIKKYGTNHKKLTELLNNLWDEVINTKGDLIDGVSYLCLRLKSDNGKEMKRGTYTNQYEACASILYPLDMFINKQPLKKHFGNGKKDKKLMSEHFSMFLKKNP